MVSVTFLEEKTCNRCGHTFPATVDHFYRYPSGSLRGHCIGCHNSQTTANRRDRNAGVKPTQATCGCCGIRTKFITYEMESPLCTDCAGAIASFGGEVSGVMAAIKHVAEHLVEVDRRRELHRSNRPFHAHPDYFWWTAQKAMFIPRDHRDCPQMLVKLRAVLKWTVGHSIPGAESGAPS